MAYVRKSNQFIDPAGVKPTYSWTINQSTEEEVPRSRQVGDGAPTSDIGLMPQQGASFPLVFQWHGTIFTHADKTEMDEWYGLCESQSIFLIDFDSNEYEILITDWAVQRVGVAANKRGGNIPWLWKYTITIRVLTVISGDWSQV